jgi:hypothetical protein
LIALDDFLIHSDGWHVNILNAKVPSSLFEATPPRDHEDWVRLGEQLKRYDKSFEPDDFEAMLSQFSGSLVRIVGATMESFRLAPSGFRFVLELQPGFRMENPDLIQGAAELTPGAYLVTGGGELSITKLTSPEVSFTSQSPQLDPDQPVELESVDIKVVLHNDGLQDVESLPVVFHVEGPDQETREIDRMRVTVPGGGSEEVATTWVPRSPGEWRIQVEFDPGQTIPQLSGDVVSVWTSVNVSPAQGSGWQTLLSLSVSGGLDFMVPLVFGCLVLAAAITLRLSITR